MALGNVSIHCTAVTQDLFRETTTTCRDVSHKQRDEAAGPAVRASWTFGAGDSSNGRRGRKDKADRFGIEIQFFCGDDIFTRKIGKNDFSL